MGLCSSETRGLSEHAWELGCGLWDSETCPGLEFSLLSDIGLVCLPSPPPLQPFCQFSLCREGKPYLGLLPPIAKWHSSWCWWLWVLCTVDSESSVPCSFFHGSSSPHTHRARGSSPQWPCQSSARRMKQWVAALVKLQQGLELGAPTNIFRPMVLGLAGHQSHIRRAVNADSRPCAQPAMSESLGQEWVGDKGGAWSGLLKTPQWFCSTSLGTTALGI